MMSDLRLHRQERRALEQQLHCTHDARVYRRAMALLQVADGEPVGEVAEGLHTTRRSVHRWLAAYRALPTPQALADRPGRGRPRRFTAEDLAVVEECLKEPPSALGYWANDWTVPLLSEHLNRQGLPSCSPRTLYRQLDALDEAWKRPRHVLPPDPEKEKKTPDPNQTHASAAPLYRAVRG
jgi:transposase